MASAQTLKRQHAATPGTMLLQRLHRIFGTGGMKPAIGPEHRADQVLIPPYKDEQQTAHQTPLAGTMRSSSASSAAQSIEAASPLMRTGVSRMTQSLPARRERLCLNHSLRTRLTRLRSTARRRMRFGTINPNLASPGPLPPINTEMPLPRSSLPPRRTATKSRVHKRCR